MPLSGRREAEPVRRVVGVDVMRFGEPVTRVQIQPAAPQAPQKHALVLVGSDLFNMALVHVLVVATVVTTAIIHTHEDTH